MRALPRRNLLVAGIIAAVVLVVVGPFAWRAKKTHDLESSALSGTADATRLLREAVALPLGGPRSAAQLQASAAAVDAHLAALRAEDASRNRGLAEAAELYLVDVGSILRSAADASRALVAASASRGALAAHFRRAGTRGTGWIHEALVLKKRAERDNFDARTAAEALASLLKYHGDSQEAMRAAAPGVPLLAATERDKMRQATKDAVQKAERDLERMRQLPR